MWNVLNILCCILPSKVVNSTWCIKKNQHSSSSSSKALSFEMEDSAAFLSTRTRQLFPVIDPYLFLTESIVICKELKLQWESQVRLKTSSAYLDSFICQSLLLFPPLISTTPATYIRSIKVTLLSTPISWHNSNCVNAKAFIILPIHTPPTNWLKLMKLITQVQSNVSHSKIVEFHNWAAGWVHSTLQIKKERCLRLSSPSGSE